MKILLVKSEINDLEALEALSDSLLWIDELCHGLLSQARFDGYFQRQVKNGDLILLRPSDSLIDCAIVYTKKTTFPWERCEDLIPDKASVFYAGDFSETDISHGTRKRSWNKFQAWEKEKNERAEI